MAETNVNGMSIDLTNYYESYSPGEIIEGQLNVNYDKPKSIKEITIYLMGKGEVFWTETESYRIGNETKFRPVTYSASEYYTSQIISLAGDGDNVVTLPAGLHTYPFQFTLPQQMPSSFSGSQGSVEYVLEAEIKRRLLVPNNRHAVSFEVNGVLDLNKDPRATKPQETSQTKGPNILVFRKGELGFSLKLPRSGYIPGDIIQPSCEISNCSNKKITSVHLWLQQVATFVARNKSKVTNTVMSEIAGPQIAAGNVQQWTPENWVVPQIPPSKLGGNCHIIKVEYYVTFEMKVSGLSSSLTANMPVVIGTIPLN